MPLFDESPGAAREFGETASRSQLQVVRNQRVGKRYKGAGVVPQFVAVARTRISSVEFFAYSISMSKKPLSSAAVSQSSNSPSLFWRAALCVINSSYGKGVCG